jgi:PTH1 family peptidyl-tRNA hydrolase
MWLIAGLGNPGDKYRFTRHNIGFMAIDAMLSSTGRPLWKNEHNARTYHYQLDGEKVLLAQPQTFMNRSGESIQALMSFYKIPLEKLLVIHDDLDLEFGVLKLQKDRGHGGHNGIRDIHEKLGTQKYARLKLGIGRPTEPDYVLKNFTKEEQALLPDFLSRAVDAIDDFIFEGFDKAASLNNKKA